MTKQLIQNIVVRIDPHDELEKSHQADVLSWIGSDAPLFRIAKPANPPKHLVSYFVLYDDVANKFMLVDHIKAKSWLPTGGHVEIGENPRLTVLREAREELNINAEFTEKFGDDPLFITVTDTKGTDSHTDVSLWYIVKGDSTQELDYDPSEMNGYKWLSPDEILLTNISELDPHMHRFVRKTQVGVD